MAHASRRKQYLTVFLALVVLTALEVGIVYLHLPRGILISALVGLALSKAAAVALYFMHLNDETRTLRVMVLGTLLTFPPLYAFVLIAEAVYRHSIFR